MPSKAGAGLATRRGAEGSAGLTIVEVLVATFIFSIAAMALAGTLASAERARRTSDRWFTATQLAAERLERLRTGDRTPDERPIGGFERTWRSRTEPGIEGIERVEVRVTWQDRRPRSFTLVSFLRVNE